MEKFQRQVERIKRILKLLFRSPKVLLWKNIRPFYAYLVAFIVLILLIPVGCRPPKSLHEAATMGDMSKIRQLVKDGVRIDAGNEYWGNSPLHCAAEGRGPLDEEGSHAAGLVTPTGHPDVVKFLLEHGVDVNIRDRDGQTPLYWAVANHNNVEVVRLLLEKGANPNISDGHTGSTPLYRAAAWGCVEIVTLLIKYGADIEARDESGETPLSAAATTGNRAVVSILLKAGANARSRSNENNTPLHGAACSGDLETVLLLLRAGADVNASTDSQYTPLDFAEEKKHPEIIRELVRVGGMTEMQKIHARKKKTPALPQPSVSPYGTMN